jgi:Spy/CpxP family protein refolding chaperone
MMRTSHAVALVALSIVSAAQLAQAQTTSPRARQEQRAAGRGIDGRGGRGLFRDIALSETEKSKVKEIHAKYRTESKALRESLRPAMQEVRTARQKGDSVAAKAAWDRTQRGRESLQALATRERGEIRSALSADNQRRFDANVQQLRQRRAEGRKGGKEGRGRGEGRTRRGTRNG